MLLIQLLFKRFLPLVLFTFCIANKNLGANMDVKFNINSANFTMIYVNGSSFIMGNDNKEKNQKSAHKVSLSDFYIGQTEVTQELY